MLWAIRANPCHAHSKIHNRYYILYNHWSESNTEHILCAACAFFSFVHAVVKCSTSLTSVNLYSGLFCDSRDACHSWLDDDVINFIIIYRWIVVLLCFQWLFADCISRIIKLTAWMTASIPPWRILVECGNRIIQLAGRIFILRGTHISLTGSVRVIFKLTSRWCGSRLRGFGTKPMLPMTDKGSNQQKIDCIINL